MDKIYLRIYLLPLSRQVNRIRGTHVVRPTRIARLQSLQRPYISPLLETKNRFVIASSILIRIFVSLRCLDFLVRWNISIFQFS